MPKVIISKSELNQIKKEIIAEILPDVEESIQEIFDNISLTDLDLEPLLKKLKGQNGIMGEKGDKGEPGEGGRDGIDGIDGKPGEDGQDGIDGQDGKNGLNGKDGSPDTPDQVIDKIHQSKKLIAIEKIRGLVEELRFLKSRPTQFFGGGGGGGHTYINEVPTGTQNASNLVFTLTQRVANDWGGVPDIILWINGKALYPNQQFTVNNNTKELTISNPTDAPEKDDQLFTRFAAIV